LTSYVAQREREKEREKERERERELYSHKCRQNQKGKRPSMLVPMIVTM